MFRRTVAKRQKLWNTVSAELKAGLGDEAPMDVSQLPPAPQFTMPQLQLGQILHLDPELLPDVEYGDLAKTLMRRDGVSPGLLVRQQLVTIFNNVKKKEPYQIIRGVAGAGKTVSLVVLAQEFRRAGALVAYIRGKDFSDDRFDEFPADGITFWITQFLKLDMNRALLNLNRCSFSPDRSLLDLLLYGLSAPVHAVEVFVRFLSELRKIENHTVMLCVDQYNALLTEAQQRNNVVAKMLGNWNTYRLQTGPAIYAYSSSFQVEANTEDGNRASEETIVPFTVQELGALLFEWQKQKVVAVTDEMFQSYVTRVQDITHCVPREVGLLCVKFANFFDDSEVLSQYYDQATRHYKARYRRVLSKDGLGQALLDDSVLFAASLFTGSPLRSIPESWVAAGLMSKLPDDMWDLPCPAASRAFFCVFASKISDKIGIPVIEAIKLWLNSPNTSWYALELAVVHRLRFARTSIKIRRINLALEDTKEELDFKIQSVQTCSKPNTRFSIKPGEAWVLWRGAAVADVFVYTMAQEKIWIQISEAAYAKHDSQLPHLFTSGAIPGIPVYNFFRWCIEPTFKHNGKYAALESNEYYVYLTASASKMMKTNDSFRPEVIVVPLQQFHFFFGKAIASLFVKSD